MTNSDNRLDGLLRLMDLHSDRTRLLATLEWKIGWSIWTLVMLAGAAALKWKISVSFVFPFLTVLIVITAVHVFWLMLVFNSQWKVAGLWDNCLNEVHSIHNLTKGKNKKCRKTWRVLRWFLWGFAEVGITILLLLAVLKFTSVATS